MMLMELEPSHGAGTALFRKICVEDAACVVPLKSIFDL